MHKIDVIARECFDKIIDVDKSCFTAQRLCLPSLNVDLYCTDSAYTEMCIKNIYQQNLLTDWQPDVTFYCIDSESLDWSPPPPWPYEEYDRRAANQIYAEQGLHGAYMHDPRVWQFYDPQKKIAIQWIRRPGCLPLWESGGPLRTLLHWAYLEKQKRLCHAATLGNENKGIVLVGAGGSGKSGTTLAGIAHGLKTVGDDYCLLDYRESVCAYPLYEILKQDHAAVKRTLDHEHMQKLPSLNWQKKYEIHNENLPCQPFIPRMQIAALVIPQIGNFKRSEFLEISPAYAMRAFAPSSIFQLPDSEEEGIAFAAKICRHLPCLTLHLSSDAEEISDCIKGYLNAH